MPSGLSLAGSHQYRRRWFTAAASFCRLTFGAGLPLFLAACADRHHEVVISVPEQRLALLNDGVPTAVYPVSTSRFGLGDAPGSNGTPLGNLEVADKFGSGAPLGMKFKNREATGEVVPVNAPGRDPIVTRILWLRGLDPTNANAYERYIYIHGTPEESRLGTPASYGCIRMRSRDIATLYDEVGRGARVYILNAPLNQAIQPHLAANASVLTLDPALTMATTALPVPLPTAQKR